jgi:GntR family transcriptional regulator
MAEGADGTEIGAALLLDPPDLSVPGDLPAHARIAFWLERLILSGRLTPGDRLPAELEIAATLKVSRATLRQALATVEGKGLLHRRRGHHGGNFITQPRFDFQLTGLPGFTEQMRRSHAAAGAEIIRARTCGPPADARTALRVRRGQMVHEIVRVRSANGEPVALEETYLPAAVFPGLLEMDVTGSIYRLIEHEFGLRPHTADEVIDPVKASRSQAELLGVRRDDPLLLVTRTSFAEDGTAVEFSHDYFRPDRARITLRTRVDHGPQAAAT